MKSTRNAMIGLENIVLRSPIQFKQWSYCLLVIFFTVLFTGCQKQNEEKTQDQRQSTTNNQHKTGPGALSAYTGLSQQTIDELQQLRDATAKYHTIKNAFADQYVDIGLKMENMGYHFLKASLVSPVFNLTKPALLVYNKKDNDNFELVAVEYAVPIDPQHVNTPPQGFSGDADEWDFNTLNTGWWTLHAWVWQFNPTGVFKPTNPLVQVR